LAFDKVGDDTSITPIKNPGYIDDERMLVMAALWNRAGHYIFALWFLLSFFMVALWNMADRYIFILWFLLLLLSSSFFPRLISAVADWMSAILPHMVWP